MLNSPAMATHRLYYDNPFMRTFEAEVLRCDPGAAAATPIPPPLWEVVLDRTAFYPESGGQPWDTGCLGEASVVAVRDDGDEIVHLTDRPVPSGKVSGAIDWPRRFDHMQQHTGQHVLSAVLQERFGLPTVSFHLGADVCTIDLRGPEPDASVLEGAERAANDAIFEDRPVTARYGTAEQFAELGVRKQVDRSGILRGIEIEGLDLQPCGGTHVARTGQIGAILLRRCTKIRQDWRLEFVCGARAASAARRDFELIRDAATALKCAPADLPETARRLLAERDALFKSAGLAWERLAVADAPAMLAESPAAPGGLRIVARVLQGSEPAYLAQLATQLAKAERTVALLARAEDGYLVFAQHPDAGLEMNKLMRRLFESVPGKGGGTRDFARGALVAPADAARAIEIVRASASQPLQLPATSADRA